MPKTKTTASETENTENLEQDPTQDTEQEAPATQDTEQEGKIRRGDELVEVELFYDGDKYKEPVPVIVNGVKIMVPRGKPVKIKRKYAEALDHSLSQDKKAGLMQARLAAEFTAETKNLGLESE